MINTVDSDSHDDFDNPHPTANLIRYILLYLCRKLGQRIRQLAHLSSFLWFSHNGCLRNQYPVSRLERSICFVSNGSCNHRSCQVYFDPQVSVHVFLVGVYINKRARLLQSLVFFSRQTQKRRNVCAVCST